MEHKIKSTFVLLIVINSFLSLVVADADTGYMTWKHAASITNAALTGNHTDLVTLQQSAGLGNVNAETSLGEYYRQEKNYVKAAYLWQKAAIQRDAFAEFLVGRAYYEGQGVPQNPAKASYWFKKSAKQGNTDAEFSLGIFYWNGYGTPKNYARANYWYLKAAEQGYAYAEYNLGMSYYYGQGVPKNYAKTDYWWQKAAMQGAAPAENNLGNSYYYGQGVPKKHE
ncbi:tetratricopeptide repeat protein [Acidithiobacillus ferriphilus]|uniref:tetratricopeptide repeat protein n=1 Tax=Acidithiobacillus ferriphilus TaxID=1689834 RepID=UPI00390C445A